MKDTAPEIDDILHDLFRSKTGEERLLMGCSMFDFSKEIVISSIKQKRPTINHKDLKIEVFNRLYASDFDEETFQKIQKYLCKA